MKLQRSVFFLLMLFCIGLLQAQCATRSEHRLQAAQSNAYALKTKKLDLFDRGRGRNIPVVTYQGETVNKPVVIINHGYGAKNSEYSFVANALAAHGYFIVSIQHDLETDKPLPTTGNLFDRRKPFWERGVQNILFVIGELKKMEPTVDLRKVI